MLYRSQGVPVYLRVPGLPAAVEEVAPVKAVFLCPTMGRPPLYLHLLEEAVESFRRQIVPPDWTTELLICNDCPEQRLTCTVPGVRVLNLPERIKDLGSKYNFMVEAAPGDIYLPAEDDDISLPHRLPQAIDRLSDGSGYFNPQASWYWDQRGLHSRHQHGICHNSSAFVRSAWERVGGYPECSGDQDARMDRLLKSAARVARPLSPSNPAEWSYCYCWGRGFHLSGNGNHQAAWEAEGKRERVAGVFEIRPQWHRDYLGEIRRHLKGRQ